MTTSAWKISEPQSTDHLWSGDIADYGVLDIDKVRSRILVLRSYLLNATLADHPGDIFDAAYELAELTEGMDMIRVIDRNARKPGLLERIRRWIRRVRSFTTTGDMTWRERWN